MDLVISGVVGRLMVVGGLLICWACGCSGDRNNLVEEENRGERR